MPRKAKAPNVAHEPVAPPAPVKSNRVFNCIEHTTLHLGDGRTLLYGEGAEVSEELADLLRSRGQAE
jgi:hypothetical protein